MLSGVANINDVTNCYRYILGREMNDQEIKNIMTSQNILGVMDVDELRRAFLRSPEFHGHNLETVFENLVPRSTIVVYETERGFKIFLDLRQLHVSFGVLNELYEQHEIALLRRVVTEDTTFLDVGANCGYYSLSIAADAAFRGRIVAFEPLPLLHGLFERSIAANGFAERIQVHQLALADQAGAMPITNAELSTNAGATMLAFDGIAPEKLSRTVRVETLDRIRGDLRPDVIKIDIQGAEALFLRGAEHTIGACRPTLFFEVAPQLLAVLSKARPCDLQSWLWQRGYALWILQEQELRPVAPWEDLGAFVTHDALIDVLAVHADREPALRSRLGDLPRPA